MITTLRFAAYTLLSALLTFDLIMIVGYFADEKRPHHDIAIIMLNVMLFTPLIALILFIILLEVIEIKNRKTI
jgi:membrane protein DedA with SNARE-associated domain